MINKVVPSFDAAVADIEDGARIHIGGFVGPNYTPSYLIAAVARKAPRRLTIATTAMGLGRRQARDYGESMKHLFDMPVGRRSRPSPPAPAARRDRLKSC